MTIIQSYVGECNSTERKCGRLIQRCMRLSDLDLYLHNLDRQAQLHQQSTPTVDDTVDKIIEKQNAQLFERIQERVMHLVFSSNLNHHDVIRFTYMIRNTFGNDVDMINMKPNHTIQAYKSYIIAGIILDSLSKLESRETSLSK